MTLKRFVTCAISSLLLFGADADAKTAVVPGGQPAEERAMQDRLPKSNDALWSKFVKCKVGYNKRTGIYNIAVTNEVRAMGGQAVTASGWVLPLDGSDHTKHFLLTRRTPVCLFCPPGEPNEVAEVVTLHPIEWTNKLVTVTGLLSLIDNGEKGMFFKIDAYQVK
jgi:hypothetical protein